MKKTLSILVVAIMGYGYCSYAQTNSFPASGNVGIGTLSPAAKLQIGGELSGASTISLGKPNSPGNINVPVGGVTGGYNIDFYGWRDALTDQIGARIRAERINRYQNNSALIQGMDLVFTTSSGTLLGSLTEKMRINYDGNVGIGTAVPIDKLSVNGKIRAKEIKVENANWPDYVFAKDYQLPSLQETEEHIKENGHLSGIPSTAEVKANGLDLGEMNAKLLKKIEELTLYLIEQDKKIIKLQKRDDDLRSEIDKIKFKL